MRMMRRQTSGNTKQMLPPRAEMVIDLGMAGRDGEDGVMVTMKMLLVMVFRY